jgi:8-oxo-dGTP diphosphatase
MTSHSITKRLRATVIVSRQEGILLAGDRSGLVLLPGGGIDHGELPIAAAARELHEETSLVASSLRFLFLFESPTNLHHIFFCQAEGVPVAADDAEYLVFLDRPVAESSLNLSPATLTILTRFEALIDSAPESETDQHRNPLARFLV